MTEFRIPGSYRTGLSESSDYRGYGGPNLYFKTITDPDNYLAPIPDMDMTPTILKDVVTTKTFINYTTTGLIVIYPASSDQMNRIIVYDLIGTEFLMSQVIAPAEDLSANYDLGRFVSGLYSLVSSTRSTSTATISGELTGIVMNQPPRIRTSTPQELINYRNSLKHLVIAESVEDGIVTTVPPGNDVKYCTFETPDVDTTQSRTSVISSFMDSNNNPTLGWTNIATGINNYFDSTNAPLFVPPNTYGKYRIHCHLRFTNTTGAPVLFQLRADLRMSLNGTLYSTFAYDSKTYEATDSNENTDLYINCNHLDLTGPGSPYVQGGGELARIYLRCMSANGTSALMLPGTFINVETYDMYSGNNRCPTIMLLYQGVTALTNMSFKCKDNYQVRPNPSLSTQLKPVFNGDYHPNDMIMCQTLLNLPDSPVRFAYNMKQYATLIMNKQLDNYANRTNGGDKIMGSSATSPFVKNLLNIGKSILTNLPTIINTASSIMKGFTSDEKTSLELMSVSPNLDTLPEKFKDDIMDQLDKFLEQEDKPKDTKDYVEELGFPLLEPIYYEDLRKESSKSDDDYDCNDITDVDLKEILATVKPNIKSLPKDDQFKYKYGDYLGNCSTKTTDEFYKILQPCSEVPPLKLEDVHHFTGNPNYDFEFNLKSRNNEKLFKTIQTDAKSDKGFKIDPELKKKKFSHLKGYCSTVRDLSYMSFIGTGKTSKKNPVFDMDNFPYNKMDAQVEMQKAVYSNLGIPMLDEKSFCAEFVTDSNDVVKAAEKNCYVFPYVLNTQPKLALLGAFTISREALYSAKIPYVYKKLPMNGFNLHVDIDVDEKTMLVLGNFTVSYMNNRVAKYPDYYITLLATHDIGGLSCVGAYLCLLLSTPCYAAVSAAYEMVNDKIVPIKIEGLEEKFSICATSLRPLLVDGVNTMDVPEDVIRTIYAKLIGNDNIKDFYGKSVYLTPISTFSTPSGLIMAQCSYFAFANNRVLRSVLTATTQAYKITMPTEWAKKHMQNDLLSDKTEIESVKENQRFNTLEEAAVYAIETLKTPFKDLEKVTAELMEGKQTFTKERVKKGAGIVKRKLGGIVYQPVSKKAKLVPKDQLEKVLRPMVTSKEDTISKWLMIRNDNVLAKTVTPDLAIKYIVSYLAGLYMLEGTLDSAPFDDPSRLGKLVKYVTIPQNILSMAKMNGYDTDANLGTMKKAIADYLGSKIQRGRPTFQQLSTPSTSKPVLLEEKEKEKEKEERPALPPDVVLEQYAKMEEEKSEWK